MGNTCQQPELSAPIQYDTEDDDQWEIIQFEGEIQHPARLTINRRSKEIFVNDRSLFKDPIKVVTTTRKISKKILELQNKIGGETLFGVNPKKVIVIEKEPQMAQEQIKTFMERPMTKKTRPRKILF